MRLKPNHYDEEPYRLFVNDHTAEVLNRFEHRVAYVYLWGGGSPDAIWLVQCDYIWGNISVRLFDDAYQEQKRFKRREEAIQFIEERLNITRDAIPRKRLTPAPGKTMWETEDEAGR